MKTRQKGCDTPSAILIWGGISHWAAKGMNPFLFGARSHLGIHESKEILGALTVVDNERRPENLGKSL